MLERPNALEKTIIARDKQRYLNSVAPELLLLVQTAIPHMRDSDIWLNLANNVLDVLDGHEERVDQDLVSVLKLCS